MGRDPVGAKAVNLTAGPREDIYQIVADKVAHMVEQDADCVDRPEALAWYTKVTRKVVKRGVMTKPYGLTHVGMRDQLISDRHQCWEGVEGDTVANATYMRDLMAQAIEDTVHASVHVMDWMQTCATLLAKAGSGISWTTPTGLKVEQRYTKFRTRVYTVTGVLFKTKREITVATPTDEIRVGKQALAIAPNIVHSFDAAHMQMAISRASEGMSFSAVHDSFGCHACDMDEFLEVIKDTFIEMYSKDVLADLYHEFEAQATAVGVDDLPLPPALGDFDIGEVAKSDFFFA